MIESFNPTPIATIVENLSEAFSVIARIGDAGMGKTAVDLSGVTYAPPSFVMPLLFMAQSCEHEVEWRCSDYLKNIEFPHGLDTQNIRRMQLKATLNDYADKDYIAIIKFPAATNSEDYTSTIISCVEATLYEQLRAYPTSIINGLRYIIGEIVDNVTQHSQAPYGYLYSLINRSNEYVEIAIADQGIGLLGSYHANDDKDICSDLEAIQAANRGISTKNRPEAENRGFGIITSKRMIIDGLKGTYAMISGNALSIKSPSATQYIQLAPNIKFDGTIVLFRIPLTTTTFNYINYIE
ncbi:MAG: sensor histidine kinase [Bacteroidaceae bacterium]|nr:sensor histidine kinase [Bacteroidaceae bacterium]